MVLLQNIVKDLGKESRKGLTDGLRDFVKVDNERALDVGSPGRDTSTFQVRKPKVSECLSDVTVRENPDELTLRAEEVETSKALMNINHIEPERWGPLLVDADWCAFCQALYKGIDGEDWEEMYESCKESLSLLSSSLLLLSSSSLLLFFFSLFSLFSLMEENK